MEAAIQNRKKQGIQNKLQQSQQKQAGSGKKKGALVGVFIPTCENMWGVLIFLRFFTIVGHAGIIQAVAAVFLSLGPYFGASVGVTYWLAFTMLAVLECIGAVE